MLPINAQTALDGWISAATPVVQKMYGQTDSSWAEVRAGYVDGLDRVFPAPEGVSFTQVDLGGVCTMVITPENVIEGRTLFYIHGGGYVHGGVNAYRGLGGIMRNVFAPVFTFLIIASLLNIHSPCLSTIRLLPIATYLDRITPVHWLFPVIRRVGQWWSLLLCAKHVMPTFRFRPPRWLFLLGLT